MFPGEKVWTCYIVTGNVYEKLTQDQFPGFQSIYNWDICTENCPYTNDLLDSTWDMLYSTSECEDQGLEDTKINRNGYCEQCKETIPWCDSCDDFKWMQAYDDMNEEETLWHRRNECNTCKRDISRIQIQMTSTSIHLLQATNGGTRLVD